MLTSGSCETYVAPVAITRVSVDRTPIEISAEILGASLLLILVIAVLVFWRILKLKALLATNNPSKSEFPQLADPKNQQPRNNEVPPQSIYRETAGNLYTAPSEELPQVNTVFTRAPKLSNV